MILLNEMVLHEVLKPVNHHLEQLCGTRSQCTNEETQDQYEVLLRDVLFTPRDKTVVCGMGVQVFSSLEVILQIRLGCPNLCRGICRDPTPLPPH